VNSALNFSPYLPNGAATSDTIHRAIGALSEVA